MSSGARFGSRANTDDDPGRVAVTSPMTPTWLVDESGRVVAGYAADYLVRLGRVRDEEQLARDRADAFANVAPSFDQDSRG